MNLSLSQELIFGAIATVITTVVGALGTVVKILWDNQRAWHNETREALKEAHVKLDECEEDRGTLHEKCAVLAKELQDLRGRLAKS